MDYGVPSLDMADSILITALTANRHLFVTEQHSGIFAFASRLSCVMSL